MVTAAGLITFWQELRHEKAETEEPAGIHPLLEMQGRLIVGGGNFVHDPELQHVFYNQAQAMNQGSVEQRLCFVILRGELRGPEDALDQLDQLRQTIARDQVSLSPSQQDLIRIVNGLYRDYHQQRFSAPNLDEADRNLLRKDLGWFGELALVPAGGPNQADREEVLNAAYRTMAAIMGLVCLWGALGLAGLTEGLVLLAFLLAGKLRSGLSDRLPHGGVYAETFALWLVLYFGLDIAVSRLAPPDFVIAGLAGAMLLSLVVLAWPVLRGVPWRQVRRDIGLWPGRQPALEPLAGLGCYALAIPLLFLGLAVFLVLLQLQAALTPTANPQDQFNPIVPPSHPIVPIVVAADWWVRVQVFVLASVVAPLVEETMFR
ncbi:MAG: hypothetical protein JO112_14350, partial [Planctomycetes bacterium]|nr:hypothetical protein [Planctomycetota bacterium]